MSVVPYTPAPSRAWAEIDLGALRHNTREARRRAGCDLMAVVKAGAYGHGLERAAAAFVDEGVAFLGVAHAGEARRLAEVGFSTPLYLLGPTWEEEREEIVARGWAPCLSSLEEAHHFSSLAETLRPGRPLAVHLAIDTGMGRGGFLASEVVAAMEAIARLPGIVVEGAGSHLSSADEDAEATRQQVEAFSAVLDALGGPKRFRWRHLGNSAGLLAHDLGPCNLARPGLMLYGIAPVPPADAVLRPAMTLKARVTLVRTLPPGHGVSYGRTYVTDRPTRVATVGIGYGDGYPRHLSGRGAEVVIRGARHPLLGRVTMDQVMVDVGGDDEIRAGDEVVLFGDDPKVDQVASLAGTIAWELLTQVTPRVERRYAGGSDAG